MFGIRKISEDFLFKKKTTDLGLVAAFQGRKNKVAGLGSWLGIAQVRQKGLRSLARSTMSLSEASGVM
jgi:hypothetical protein